MGVMIQLDQSERLLDAALKYAVRGYPVFPIDPGKIYQDYLPPDKRTNRKPLVKWGRCATINPRIIQSWWRKWPLAMIGMPTGQKSGVIVLDIDIKNDQDGFRSLEEIGTVIPPTPVVARTPSGGYHFFYQAPKGYKIKNSASKIADGVDVRGDGGMVILPPSHPIEKASYEFEGGALWN